MLAGTARLAAAFTNHSPGVLWCQVSECNSGVIFRFLIIFRDASVAFLAAQPLRRADPLAALNKGGIAERSKAVVSHKRERGQGIT